MNDHDRQRLLSPSMYSPGFSSGQPSPLKPMYALSMERSHGYEPTPNLDDIENLNKANYEDMKLKQRIRHFRIISRVASFLISIAVLVPITMTVVKFLNTQNTFRDVVTNGKTVSRTAWAKGTRPWPTWMYFSVAVASVVLNFATVFSYKFGVEQANVASWITSTFSWIIMIGNLVVWTVAASIYRKERNRNDKPNDLWGWTCSAAARAIQKEFTHEVDFDQYCTTQSVSFYIGIVQAVAAAGTVAIYVLVFMRRKSKKVLALQMKVNGFEPARR